MMTEEPTTNRWKINREISLGDVVAILIAITAVLTAYMNLNTRMAVIENITNTNTIAIKSIVQEINTELRRLNDRLDRIVDLRNGDKNGN